MSAIGTAVLAGGSLDHPDETRHFDHGHMAVVEVAGHVVGRAVFEPGWRWSEHVRPVAGTESCQVRHVGYILSGAMTVVMEDGRTASAGPGDVVVIDPGHDGWVDGDEACVMLDWGGAGTYASGR